MKSLKTLNELCGYAEKVDKKQQNKDACKNLLDNLCTGLEKFLGFSNGSYTGSGIVYSDLDRLCDGVMSFLHGVLETVKGDESVKKYDHKTENINKIIETLNSNVGKGRQAFGDAVSQVSSTSNVTIELGKYVQDVSRQQDKPLKEQLDNWTKTVEDINTHINDNIITNVSKLDPALSDKITRKIEPVQKVVAHLGKVAGDGGLEMMVTEVDNELLQQKNKLEGKINMQTHIVQVTLDEEFGKILKNMNILHRQRHEHFKVIRDSLDVAKLKVDEWLGNPTGTTRVEILGFLDEVTTQINGVYTTLLSKKFDLDKLVEQTQEHFETLKKNTISLIGKNEESIEYNWKILKAKVTLLCESISYGYDGTSGHLGEIENKVKDYAGEFSKEKFKSSVVDEWLNDVLRTGGTVDLSIDAYILSNKRSGYFQQQDQGGIKQKVIKHIRKVIDSKLQSIITGVTAVENSDKAGIATNLTKIKTCIDSFVQELTKSMQSAEFKSSKIVPEIVAEYDSDSGLVVKSKKDTQADNLLYSAFNRILKHLTERAKKASTERAWLDGTTDKTRVNGKSTIANEIDEAIKKVELIGKEFKDGENSKQSHGKKLDAALKTVKQEIDTLTPLLNKAAKSGSILKKLGEMSPPLATLERIQRNDATGEINKKRKDVDDKMQALRDNIAAVITAITLNVDKADKSLYEAIDAVDKSARSAQRIAEDSVKQLENALLQQVKTSFTTLTNSVRSLFSTSHAADLQALRELVDEQLREVQKIIDADAVTGVKGLLQGLNGMRFGINKYGVPQFTTSPDKNLLQQIKKEAESHQSNTPIKDTFTKLAKAFHSYFTPIHSHIERQIMEQLEKLPDDKRTDENLNKLNNVNSNFDTLLTHFNDTSTKTPTRKYLYDYTFDGHLNTLISSLSSLSPNQFANPRHPELLDAVKEGLQGFTEELKKAYVNAYEEHPDQKEWKEFVKAAAQSPSEKYVLTSYGTNLSKVFLTVLEILTYYLSKLREASKHTTKWRNQKVNLQTDLGKFLKKHGYEVSGSADKQNGELNKDKDGWDIYRRLCGSITENRVYIVDIDNTQYGGRLTQLVGHLHHYYQVRHYYIPPKPRAPSSVNQMLQWLAGLYYNPIFGQVKGQINKLLEGLQEEHKLNDAALEVAVPDDMKTGIQSPLDAGQVNKVLDRICYHSYYMLTQFLGHGQADGRYACEFNTNTDHLYYPSRASACLDMLVDLVNRLFQQLRFLYLQCTHQAKFGGWADCHYGKNVGGSNWKCNDFQCPKQDCDQKHNLACNQSGDQKSGQTADQHYDCGIKSPLQSFLEDALPGFLPHSFKTPGCKLTCSLSNHHGIPCITPMGFSDIGIAASHTKNGRYLREHLFHFCDRPDGPLRQLCFMFKCLMPAPPKTLGDMFAFYYLFIYDWNGKGKEHRQTAFNDAVSEAYFGNAYTALDPCPLFASSGHAKSHNNGNLLSIVNCNSDAKDTCGHYVESLSSNVYNVFSSSHKKLYLSWIVYLTETFYDMLQRLLDECCKKCDTPGSRCHDRRCADKCHVKLAHESKDSTAEEKSKKLATAIHQSDCKSISHCPSMRPTLCKFGFAFASPSKLNGYGFIGKKRSCKDFCSALKNILKEQSILIHFIKQIDEFMWAIRENFSYLLLALWSLSLLYLLHIAVVRLDVLRIRSHLRSPASHRIAAQSLLAAARVKALANVNQINNLKKSDNPNENKLNKLQSDLSSHKSEVHNNTSKRDGALKDIHSRMVSLAELSGKLGQFIGQSEAVTKAIKNGIDSIIDSDEDFKSLRNSPSSPVQSSTSVPAVSIDTDKFDEKIKRYEEQIKLLKPKIEEHKTQKTSVPDDLNKSHESCQSKLDALQRLKSLNESFKSLNNKHDDACKNLLDNLCTGLEKFLGYQGTSKGYDGSGIVYSDLDRLCDGVMAFILECLKGSQTLLHHYYPQIIDTIRELEDKIGKGSGVSGFRDAIGRVQQGLQGYEGEMDGRTQKVISELDTIITLISVQLSYMPSIKSSKLSSIQNVMNKLLEGAVKAMKGLKENKEGFNGLDEGLKSKLNIPLDKLSIALTLLYESADNEKLSEKADKVDKELVVQQKKITDEISMKSEELKRTLNAQFWKIFEEFGRLRIEKKLQFERINERLEEAQKFLESEFDTNFSEQISWKFDEIKIAVTNAYDTLKAHKDVLDGLVAQAEHEYGTITRGVKEDATRSSHDISIQKNWRELQVTMNGLVATLTKPRAGSAEGGTLQQIVDGVIAYAQGFAQKAFEQSTLKQWVKEIVNAKETIVSSRIGTYVINNKANGKLNDIGDWDAKGQAVKAAIIAELPGCINTGVESAAIKAGLQKATVKDIGAKFNEFSSQVEKELTGSESKETMEAAVRKIGEALEMNRRVNPRTPLSDDKHLTDVVKAIANSIVKNFKQVAEELQRFTASSKINTNLDAAILSVKTISSHFNGGHRIDDALSAVTPAITRLEKLLQNKSGEIEKNLDELKSDVETLGNAIKKKDENGIIAIKKHEADKKMKDLKHTISYKINLIREQVSDAEKALTYAIKTLEDTVAAAKEALKNAISTVQTQLTDEVKKAFKTVTEEVQALFSVQKQTDLEVLKQCVEWHKDEMKGMIAEDKKSGLKGFCGKLNELFVTKVSDMKDIPTFTSYFEAPENSPLKRAAGLTTKAFSGFIGELQDQDDFKALYPKVEPSVKSLIVLLENIVTSRHFDYKFSDHLETLQNLLSTFAPSKFTDPSNPILQCLKEGIQQLYEQLNMAYVSKYSGAFKMFNWDADGPKAAQACLSFLPTLAQDLMTLKSFSNSDWQNKQIYLYDSNKTQNGLGVFLANRGFKVPSRHDKNDAELRNKPDCTGSHIFSKLTGKINGGADRLFTSIKGEKEEGLITKLFNYYESYLQVCHQTLPSAARYPCSVRDMLSWMSGVPYSHVFPKLPDHITKLLNEDANKNDTVMTTVLKSQTHKPLRESCKRSAHLLVAICGNGHGAEECDYPYSVCFSNNHGNFYYPSDPATLLGMVYEIVRRLCYAIYFLYAQCKRTASAGNGWKECAYGQGVPSANWSCKDHSKSKPTDQPKCQPNGQANGQANTKLNCPPTSPLQSFLRDSCAGFLPHVLTAKNNAIKCSSCKHNQPGQQCLTPMGFRDLDFAASVEHTGEYLTYYLETLCSDADACLFQLCRSLSYICPTAPKTLADVFTLYTQLFRRWESDKARKASSYYDNSAYLTHIKDNTIENSFPLNKNVHDNFDNSSLTNAITALVGHGHQSHDALSSLFTTEVCTQNNLCAPFIRPLAFSTCHTYPQKHAKSYLSWILYLAWDLWKFLKSFFDAFEQIECKAHGCSTCSCRPGKHGHCEDDNPSCKCSSVVGCRSVLPLLYKYGMTFGSTSRLQLTDVATRKCHHLHKQLNSVLKSQLFDTLFKECDNFLWYIRLPFSFFLLALWSLSLLYLLHIAVVRLDVLRIRSHLRSPSSHRIAAQSLLAAARVRALANVKYFSP
ncbi:hypothetical protein, conserved [Babesia ovata]|uniref:Uncharacterized protein n=1 Tax=Babesia ovata TaxID=189622 RepID=A0A2H6KJR0_9APIC|nr:uncharacterized protein BOVATA_047280 [Babesia ovata]GBE63235.1 hypothetical protein, conserved [Babesia ovata]